MSESVEPRELTIDEVRFLIFPETLGYETTADLTPLDEVIGQPRAMRAFELGLGVRHPNYHIFAAGTSGTGRMEMIRKLVAEHVRNETVPPDWFYVNNFTEPDRPLAISLPAGQGTMFKKEMEQLIETLVDALPKAFREEDFGREKDRLRKQYRERGEQVLKELDQMAREVGLSVQQLPDGQIMFIPLKDDRPMTPEEVQQLTAEELEALEQKQQELIEKASRVLMRQQEMERQLSTDVREVARKFAERLIQPLIAEIAARYDSQKLLDWLEKMEMHLVDHLDRFRDRGSMPPILAAALSDARGGDAHDRFLEYQVNLVVDNSRLLMLDEPRPEKAPIVIEDAPNYRNIFGTIERIVDRSGRVITNFSRIKSGSLLQANGGYLILNLMDALSEPFVWKELKRTLKSGLLEIESYDPFSMFTVSALKPEPIPLTTKLVVLGQPLIYYLLCLYDDDFREIFRVKADFDDEIDRDEQAGRLYGEFVRKLSESEEVLPFEGSGVVELVRAGARLAGSREKMSTAFSRIADVIREADFWARKDNAQRVGAKYVRSALDERVFRSDLIATKIRELIADGTLLIDVREKRIGQVNGLAVADLGDYVFGRPARLTASVGVGAAGIVNIERESQLSGRTFDKGLLILEGYLRNQYARQQALALSAGIAMEQSYGGVDGDSASVAELLCLLSALAEVPLRQEIAVTGSINQWGEVQAIGGVNEKIEGFFDVCQAGNLTGTQGVCIPAANVRNLVLRNDLLEAIEQGEFHIWPVEHVDQAIALFTGMKPGDVETAENFHGRVMQRLKEMSAALQMQRATYTERITGLPSAPPGAPPDPRPPFPGME